MKTVDATIIDGYLELLSGLSPNHKLELISKLSDLVKDDLTNKKSSFKQSYGVLETKKTAEELIIEIRSSRICTSGIRVEDWTQ